MMGQIGEIIGVSFAALIVVLCLIVSVPVLNKQHSRSFEDWFLEVKVTAISMGLTRLNVESFKPAEFYRYWGDSLTPEEAVKEHIRC